MKRGVLKIVILVSFSVCFFVISCNTKTYFGRWMTWRSSDIGDANRFPAYPFTAAENPFRFQQQIDTSLSGLPVPYHGTTRKELDALLEESGSTAFLVLSHDTLVYERYFNEYSRESLNTSFSVAKSITSLMIGHAIDHRLIHSIDDPVTKYLPELSEVDSRYDKLTLAHVLDMRSGTRFKDHDLPWGDKPKAYYGPNLRDRVLHLPLTNEPGEKFQYNSYNPILAGVVLERVSGMKPAKYFEENFWNLLGMEYDGSWSLDSEEHGMTKMESGINLRAIDFLKLGRLVLQNGVWGNNRIVSEDWLTQCTQINKDEQLAEFGPEIYYSRFWWLFSKDHSTAYIVSGWGHLGQYLYIFPDEKIVIVRMGTGTGNVESWSAVFKAVARKLSE